MRLAQRKKHVGNRGNADGYVLEGPSFPVSRPVGAERKTILENAMVAFIATQSTHDWCVKF